MSSEGVQNLQGGLLKLSVPWGAGRVLERLSYLLGYIAVDAKVGKVHGWDEAWRAALHITNHISWSMYGCDT